MRVATLESGLSSNHTPQTSPGLDHSLQNSPQTTTCQCSNIKKSEHSSTNQRRRTRMATKPTHEQAQLQLQAFEQRREPRLREARDWFFKNYFVNTMEEAMKVAPMGTE